MTIEEKYQEKVTTPSDINEHLPVLRDYASLCDTVTEFGVRNPTSTYAFLVARPKKLVSYDIARWEGVDEAERLAKEEGIDFEFRLEDVLDSDIDETDFLFVDTLHVCAQLERELEKHSQKVRKFIGFHDTTTFWENGEPVYPGVKPEVNDPRGLKYALEPFLMQGTFKIVYKAENNNGLTIIERCAL